MRIPRDDLKRELKDPEFAAYFANAQQESALELLGAGIIRELNSTSMTLNKTIYIKWEVG